MIPSCLPLSLELRAFCRCTPAQVTTRSLTRRGAWVVEGTAYRTHSSYPGYVAASSQYTRSLVPSYLPLLSSLLSSSPLIPPLYPLYLLVSKPIHTLSLPLLSSPPLIPPLFPLYLFVSSLPVLSSLPLGSFFLILIPSSPLVVSSPCALSLRPVSFPSSLRFPSCPRLLSSSLPFSFILISAPLSYPHLVSFPVFMFPPTSLFFPSSLSLLSVRLFTSPFIFLSLSHALTLSLNLNLCPLSYPWCIRSLFLSHNVTHSCCYDARCISLRLYRQWIVRLLT